MDFSGPTPLRIALEKSLNLVTLRVAADRSAWRRSRRHAIAFHVVDNMPRVLPAALGAVDTTVLRVAGAYASLAEGGREVMPDADRQRAGPRRPRGLARPGRRLRRLRRSGAAARR